MSFARACRAAAAAFVIAAFASSSFAQFSPVSWRLHVSASAGAGFSDSPPDQIYGAEFGSHSHSATATNPQGPSATYSVSGTFNSSNQISVSSGGSCTGSFMGIIPGGSGIAEIVFSITAPMQVTASGGQFGISQGLAGWSIKNSASVTTNLPSNSSMALILQPDTYTLSASGSIQPRVGTSNSCTQLGTLTFDSFVPEPSSLLSCATGGFALLMKRRRGKSRN